MGTSAQYEVGAASAETSKSEIEAMRHPAQPMGISPREVGVFRTSERAQRRNRRFLYRFPVNNSVSDSLVSGDRAMQFILWAELVWASQANAELGKGRSYRDSRAT